MQRAVCQLHPAMFREIPVLVQQGCTRARKLQHSCSTHDNSANFDCSPPPSRALSDISQVSRKAGCSQHSLDRYTHSIRHLRVCVIHRRQSEANIIFRCLPPLFLADVSFSVHHVKSFTQSTCSSFPEIPWNRCRCMH